MNTPNAAEMRSAIHRLTVLMRQVSEDEGDGAIDDLHVEWVGRSSALSGKDVFVARAVWRAAFDKAVNVHA